MAQANINVRMDEDLKERFDILCNELGLNMTSAMNLFATVAVRMQRMPFDYIESYNAETIAAIEESEQLLNNPNAKRFTSVDELFKELNS